MFQKHKRTFESAQWAGMSGNADSRCLPHSILKIPRRTGILAQTLNKGDENSFFLFVCFSIFPSPDQELNPSVLPAAHNTGGSLPDLTNIQFPPPLSTPLDPEDTMAFPSLSSSNSTGSLTTNLTHLGISVASHGNSRGGEDPIPADALHACETLP